VRRGGWGVLRYITMVTQIGGVFVVNALVFLLAGQWLDSRLGTGGLLQALFLIVGVAVSFYMSYLTLDRISRRLRDDG